ncbi:hypothetical protein [Thermomonas mangrovi]|uniref:hypothetical protein n=1 Tax=Thermomonas mangrovi TaxID=2993316 RepID=UPI0023070D22|nr:hypothetical protein [Thermomonas mangrovi]
MSAISAAPLQTRMRWSADLNCFRAPSDFPLQLPELDGDRKKFEDTKWSEAFKAVNDTLNDAETSLGWWVFELKRTPAEWKSWWISRGRSRSDANAAISAFAEGSA